MKRPTSLAVADFKAQLADLINDSELPFFIVELILKDYYREVSSMSQRQTEVERQKYQEALMAQVDEVNND